MTGREVHADGRIGIRKINRVFGSAATIYAVATAIAAEAIVRPCADEGIVPGTALHFFKADQRIIAAAPVIRELRREIDADPLTRRIIRINRNIMPGPAKHGITAAIAAERIGSICADDRIIARTGADIFNIDQRVIAGHSRVRTLRRKIDRDRLRAVRKMAVISHIGTATAIKVIIAITAREAIIRPGAIDRIGIITAIDVARANQAIRTELIRGCTSGQISRNTRCGDAALIIGKNASICRIENHRVIAGIGKNIKGRCRGRDRIHRDEVIAVSRG